METVTRVRVKGGGAEPHHYLPVSLIQDQSDPVGIFWELLSFSKVLEVRGKKFGYETSAHTSAPSSSTPVSITVTYLSSIWTRSTALSMWDLVPGSLLQGAHR